jgi:Holliday junction resolvase RusA-like endonuclease
MIELVILGEPQRKQRPRFNRNTGVAYTPQDTLNYENLIKHEYMAKYGKMAFDDNDCIEATIVAYFKMPKTDFGKNGLSKSGREKGNRGFRCNTRADADNIAKVCLDALNGVAYPDDRQILSLVVLKKWSKEPRVVITLSNDVFATNMLDLD